MRDRWGSAVPHLVNLVHCLHATLHEVKDLLDLVLSRVALICQPSGLNLAFWLLNEVEIGVEKN